MITDRFPHGGETETERVVGLNQIFFSTTDRKGVITSVNDTFSTLSRYGRAELIGAPHSIIRHPDMPAAVFQIMWDRLKVGKSVVAYVKNRAKDGKSYWVFATVTPTRHGYLSVRTRPVVIPLQSAAEGIYDGTRPTELAAMSEGHRRPAAAQIGKGALSKGLASAGFQAYEDFMMTLLPAEMAERQRLSTRPTVDAQPGTPLGAIVGGSQVLESHICHLMEQMEMLGELTTKIERSLAESSSSQRTLMELAEQAQAQSQSNHTLPTAVTNTLAATETWVMRGIDALSGVAEPLAALRQSVMDVRFAIALNRLHNEMVLSAAAEYNRGAGTCAFEDIPLLCDTMTDDVENLARDLNLLQKSLLDVGQGIDSAREALGKVRSFLAALQLSAARWGVENEISEVSGAIDSVQDQFAAHLDGLGHMALVFLDLLHEVDPARLAAPVPIIADGVRQLECGDS